MPPLVVVVALPPRLLPPVAPSNTPTPPQPTPSNIFDSDVDVVNKVVEKSELSFNEGPLETEAVAAAVAPVAAGKGCCPSSWAVTEAAAATGGRAAPVWRPVGWGRV